MNKFVYLGLSILELNKTAMYQFCYDYVKAKIWQKSKTVLFGYRWFHCIHKNR